MEWVLRIMANLLRPDELGPAEAYKAASTIVRLAPKAYARPSSGRYRSTVRNTIVWFRRDPPPRRQPRPDGGSSPAPGRPAAVIPLFVVDPAR